MKRPSNIECTVPTGCPVQTSERGQFLCDPTADQWADLARRERALQSVLGVGMCMQYRYHVSPVTGMDTYPTMLGKIASRLDHPARRKADSTEGSTSLTVAFIDGRHFKKINDRYNHDVGDDVIRDMARTLIELTRDNDPRAHRSGDEFAFAWPGLTESEAASGLSRVRKGFLEGGEVKTATSESVSWSADLVGVYMPNPTKIEEVEQAFTHADDVLGSWKNNNDRGVPPPLLLRFPSQELIA